MKLYPFIIYVGTTIQKIQEDSPSSYIPRGLVGSKASCSPMQPGLNVLQRIFKDHFEELKDQYAERYAIIYGNFRLDRITEVVEEFLKCGDFKEGVARVKCRNPDCGHDYFIPLSCLSFYAGRSASLHCSPMQPGAAFLIREFSYKHTFFQKTDYSIA